MVLSSVPSCPGSPATPPLLLRPPLTSFPPAALGQPLLLLQQLLVRCSAKPPVVPPPLPVTRASAIALLWLRRLGVVKPPLAPNLLLLWRLGLQRASGPADVVVCSCCFGELASVLQLGRTSGMPRSDALLLWLQLPAAPVLLARSGVPMDAASKAPAVLPCVARPGDWDWLLLSLAGPGASLLLLLLLPELLLNRIMKADKPAGAETRLLPLNPAPRPGPAVPAELLIWLGPNPVLLSTACIPSPLALLLLSSVAASAVAHRF